MTHEPPKSADEAITFRMSMGRALFTSGAFYLYIFLLVGFLPMTRSDSTRNLTGVLLVFVVFTLAWSFGLRELHRVTVSPQGIGSRRRPIYWNEITEVERPDRFGSSWRVNAVYIPTVMVVKAIVQTPEFRDTLDRFAPEDCVIREMLTDPTQ